MAFQIDPSEKEIESAVLSYLNVQVGILAFKVNTVGIWDSRIGAYRRPSTFIIKGTPDVICCMSLKGIPIFIGMEIKSPTGIQSEDQVAFQKRLQDRADGFYFLIRSIDDAQAALNLVRTTVDQKLGGVK
jgi:hypothetical protein